VGVAAARGDPVPRTPDPLPRTTAATSVPGTARGVPPHRVDLPPGVPDPVPRMPDPQPRAAAAATVPGTRRCSSCAAMPTRCTGEAPPLPSLQVHGLPAPCFGGSEVEEEVGRGCARRGVGAARVASKGDDAGRVREVGFRSFLLSL
jgi:hypothetical protein